jgi:capsular polysaccharide biosynthesis protein
MVGYKVGRAFGRRPASLAEAADREFIVSPGVEEPAVRPFIFDDHLGRVRGGFGDRPAFQVLNDINQKRHLAAPTRALVLKDVVLFDRAFYSGHHKEDLFQAGGLRRTLFSEPAADLLAAVWASSYAGARWYGHFLHDDLPLEVLATALGSVVGHVRPRYRQEPGWRHALETPAPASYGMLRVQELMLLDDVGQNPAKRARYVALRERVRGKLGRADRVVLRRATAGGEERRIEDEERLWERLSREGFDLIDTSNVSVEELLRRCGGASLVVSVEGSHASPAFYLARPGAALVVLYPPYRVTTQLTQLATFFGLRAAMFVGEPAQESRSVFKVDAEELLRLIDRVAGEARTSSAA